MTNIDLTKMSEDELAQERAEIDLQMQELRAQKKAIQDEIDRRRLFVSASGGYFISDVGGIKTKEAIGKVGG